MSIEIKFWIKGTDGVYLSEDDIEWRIPDLKELETMLGTISIVSETCRINLTDDLDYIVPQLCFSSIPYLANNEEFNITKASASGSYLLRVDKGQLWISGSSFEPLAFHKDDFLKALFHCGLRFLEFLKSFSKNTDKYEGAINELQIACIVAQSVLGNR
jgi:hypothetical protein